MNSSTVTIYRHAEDRPMKEEKGEIGTGLKEESGIDIHISNLIGVYSNTGVHKWYDDISDVPTKLMLDYICNPIGGELSTSEETKEVRWVNKAQVLDLISAPAIRTRYEAYLNFEGKINYMEYVTRPEFELEENRTI